MQQLPANELKTRGVGAIEAALASASEVAVTVRGQPRYVVMRQEEYDRLRACELEAALAESRADLQAGRFVVESVDAHIERLRSLAG